jgi:hypothetical protein
MDGLKPPMPQQPSRDPNASDLATFLEHERQAVRVQCTVQPLSSEESDMAADAVWAQHDPDVQAAYPGEFVVPFQRRIVAHGRHAAEVLAEAARLTGRKAEKLPLVGILEPLLDLSH